MYTRSALVHYNPDRCPGAKKLSLTFFFHAVLYVDTTTLTGAAGNTMLSLVNIYRPIRAPGCGALTGGPRVDDTSRETRGEAVVQVEHISLTLRVESAWLSTG